MLQRESPTSAKDLEPLVLSISPGHQPPQLEAKESSSVLRSYGQVCPSEMASKDIATPHAYSRFQEMWVSCYWGGVENCRTSVLGSISCFGSTWLAYFLFMWGLSQQYWALQGQTVRP